MRLIDADALKEAMGEDKFKNWGYAVCMVNDAPTVVTAKRGHWYMDMSSIGIYRCSSCEMISARVIEMTKFCAYCGAKMDEVDK